jgi:prolyl-tRNA synthetase
MILNEVYADFAEMDIALPVLRGIKTEKEKFAGALRSYAIEAMMQDGRALQVGTSHNLGQNFAKAFGITYADKNNQVQHAWTTSWGVSTRLIGAIIMGHSDDDGLVLPPRLAPIQVVIVPIYKNDAEKAIVSEAIDKITAEWRCKIRFHLDTRDHLTPGFKFNEWELKGVPLRMEVGPKDVQKQSVALAPRIALDSSAHEGKKPKSFVPQAGLTEHVTMLMDQIQQRLYQHALKFREEHTFEAKNYDELKERVEQGFVRCWWAGSREDEERIQQKTKATIRVIPIDQPGGKGKCVYTGKEADKVAMFAKAY